MNDLNKIIGVVVGSILKESNELIGELSSRAILTGAPLLLNSDNESIELIINEFDKLIKKEVIYSQYRNLFELKDYHDKLIRTGYKYEEHLDIIVDLKKTESELWNEIHSKRRNEIRKAEKVGTLFKVSESSKDISETYNILKGVYKRSKLPLPDQKYFELAYEELGKEQFKIFLAMSEGKFIGTMYALCFKDTIYDWYAGSIQEYYNKYPNDLIPWKVFLWGKENGYKKFDFGGAGKPGIKYGVRDYKKKFGGDLVNYGRYEKIQKPFLYQLSKLGFKIYQKLK